MNGSGWAVPSELKEPKFVPAEKAVMGLILEVSGPEKRLESLGERSRDAAKNETYLVRRLLLLNAINGHYVEPTPRLGNAQLLQIGRPYPGGGCAGIDHQTDVNRCRLKEANISKCLPALGTDSDFGRDGGPE